MSGSKISESIQQEDLFYEDRFLESWAPGHQLHCRHDRAVWRGRGAGADALPARQGGQAKREQDHPVLGAGQAALSAFHAQLGHRGGHRGVAGCRWRHCGLDGLRPRTALDQKPLAPLWSGRLRRGGGTRERQQRLGRRGLHSHDDAGHSGRCRDGGDHRRHVHPRPAPWAAADDRDARFVLVHRRLARAGQHFLAHLWPDRHPHFCQGGRNTQGLFVAGDLDSVRRRRLRDQQQPGRCVLGAGLWRAGLPDEDLRLPGGAGDLGDRAGALVGAQLPPVDPDDGRRPGAVLHRVFHLADLRHPAAGLGL